MARICEKCERKPMSSQSRSHSNIATKKRQMVNLQWKTIDGKKTRVCTNCIKTMRKNAVKQA